MAYHSDTDYSLWDSESDSLSDSEWSDSEWSDSEWSAYSTDGSCDSDEEEGVGAGGQVIVPGRSLWQHRPGRNKKSANKNRVRMDIQERIRQLRFEGEDEFQATYKLTHSEFERQAQALDRWLGMQPSKAVNSSGSHVSAWLRLSMALRWFAGGQQKDICHMHGVHKSTFYKAVWQVVDFINGTIPLSFPLTEQEVLEGVAEGFNRITGGAINKCCGVIDGIAIKIQCPTTADSANPMQYYNRKGFYAYVMQGVCDADLRILYLSLTCVGSTHDSTSFQHSELSRAITANGGITGGFYLIGDEAYVAGDSMVVPYSGQRLPVDKDTANYYISLARQPIERCFGVLVSRFGILHRPLECRTKRVPKLLGTLARLHNLCLQHKVPSNVDYQVGDMPLVYPQDECADEERGRRRDVEVSAPRQYIKQWCADRGLVRPPHSAWGRSNQ